MHVRCGRRAHLQDLEGEHVVRKVGCPADAELEQEGPARAGAKQPVGLAEGDGGGEGDDGGDAAEQPVEGPRRDRPCAQHLGRKDRACREEQVGAEGGAEA